VLHIEGDAFSIVTQRQMLFNFGIYFSDKIKRFLIEAMTSGKRDSFSSPQIAIRSSRMCRWEICPNRLFLFKKFHVISFGLLFCCCLLSNSVAAMDIF
jgi:hypothetical protein